LSVAYRREGQMELVSRAHVYVVLCCNDGRGRPRDRQGTGAFPLVQGGRNARDSPPFQSHNFIMSWFSGLPWTGAGGGLLGDEAGRHIQGLLARATCPPATETRSLFMLRRTRTIYCDCPMSACTCSFRRMLCSALSARVECSFAWRQRATRGRLHWRWRWELGDPQRSEQKIRLRT